MIKIITGKIHSISDRASDVGNSNRKLGNDRYGGIRGRKRFSPNTLWSVNVIWSVIYD